MTAAAVYTIPPGVSFVDALASELLRRSEGDPLALPRMRLLLPTRRACRALATAFLRIRPDRPLLLPRMTPLGDVDEDEIALDHAAELGGEDALIAPAIPPLRRILLLTRLVLARSPGETSVDQAARLAQELARLLDQVQTERLDWHDLAALVPDEMAAHWQLTLRFLAILSENWPRILAEEGASDPADRRNRLLAAQALAWTKAPPPTPVIAAGSTGSIPATADLLKVVSRLPQGAVILPGLDQEADDATWAAIRAEPWHPQYGMALLLERLEVARADVRQWPHQPGDRFNEARAKLIHRALRPAIASAEPEPFGAAGLAIQHVSRLDAATLEEEARAIALIMRQTLEAPERTAALVTPDRALARRVAAELQRWSITIDDSAGLPLGDTQPGAFLRLVARMVAERFAPVPLLAALKHPLAGGGIAVEQFRRTVRWLEGAALRGPRPAPGLAGLHAALGKQSESNRRLHALIDHLAAATGPLVALLQQHSATLPDLLAAHVAAAEALAATDVETGPDRLWRGDAGEAMAKFIAELADAARGDSGVGCHAYPALFETLLAGHVVRPVWGRHPRLAIWGPLEARLQHADVLILAGLNEDSWPPRATASPWMSRPMMQAFGLPLPDRRIGLSAHDFAQAFCAPAVWLSRSRRREGTPTVPSRWLLRLEAVLRTAPARSIEAGITWLHWQALLDEPPADERHHIDPPAPCPPVTARPRQLSVTRIETWMRDPYAIYAQYILGLRALEPLDADPGAAEYGSFVHAALEHFVRQHPRRLPGDALPQLLAIGRQVFAPMLDRPGVRAFWWPRFERIAQWFVAEEQRRDDSIRDRCSEVTGRLRFEAPFAPFELTAKADRIDVLADGRLGIIDYKTGQLPTRKEVAAGFAPQLPLEAAIALAGGFDCIARAPIAQISYWRLRGNEDGGEKLDLDGDPIELAQTARAGLERLVAVFDQEETAYAARPRSSVAPRFSDYEHLARIREWSAWGGDASE